ncbi:hypothetical protein HNY73_020949 [Argiope bruennichi]|uniref:Uncharacterized protein n=1 Tax=Argiope bruennichi TaxID=94029 RepID=A0A8T0ED72_ARGBR|nr:hypothetical protein HNY73_020949 [Argiope bruennichi]
MNSSRGGCLEQHNRTMRSKERCMRSARGFAIARSALCVAHECGAELLSPQRIWRRPFKRGCTWFAFRNFLRDAKGAKTLTKRQERSVLEVSQKSLSTKQKEIVNAVVHFRQKAVRGNSFLFYFLEGMRLRMPGKEPHTSLPFEQGSNSFVNRKLFCFEGASETKPFPFIGCGILCGGRGDSKGVEGVWRCVSRDLAPSRIYIIS